MDTANIKVDIFCGIALNEEVIKGRDPYLNYPEKTITDLGTEEAKE
jgi:hypothetical protein